MRLLFSKIGCISTGRQNYAKNIFDAILPNSSSMATIMIGRTTLAPFFSAKPEPTQLPNTEKMVHLMPTSTSTFPLMPYLTEDGELQMLYNDNELPYLCPLIEEEIPLNDSFVKATHTAWKHLLRNPGIYDLIWADSEELREILR